MSSPFWLSWTVAFLFYFMISLSAAIASVLINQKRNTEATILLLFIVADIIIAFYRSPDLWIPLLCGYGFIYLLSVILPAGKNDE